MDSFKLEEEIEQINETLMRVYSRPATCCKRVKTAILSRASTKQDPSHLEFTYKEVQEIGKELIHENLYDYITYLNRKTFNDVIFRLMRKRVLRSPFFNVPQQKHRKVYRQSPTLAGKIDARYRFHGLGPPSQMLLELVAT